MSHQVPPVVSAYRAAKGCPYTVVHGPTIQIPVNGRMPQQSLPMRGGMHLLGLQVRITANSSVQTSTNNNFTDALMTEVFEDLLFRDQAGKKIQAYFDSHILKNTILAFNDELIVTPLAQLTSSSVAIPYRERFVIPLCFLEGSSSYYTMEVETGNIATLMPAGTLRDAQLDISYLYTNRPLIPWSFDSHTINGNVGANDIENVVTEGATEMFVFHSDNVVLWDEYHPYCAVSGAVGNIDDVDFLSAEGVAKNIDGYTAFHEFAEIWLNEFRTFLPLVTATPDLAPWTKNESPGFSDHDLIMTFVPSFYAAKNIRMRLELVAADAALHMGQVILRGDAEPIGVSPAVSEATSGGNILNPTDSVTVQVPVTAAQSGVGSVSRPNRPRRRISL